MKQALFNHLKNIPGWRTSRKLVVFSVDDYGNVRLDSRQAREKMDKAGLKVHSRFDALDTLETREDLEQLYEALISVKDKHGRNAVFTPFALPCNIDFERMADENYQCYRYELLPRTYDKLSRMDSQAYEGAWSLWEEGIRRGLMKAQFHGREHFNLKVFNEKLETRDNELLTALKNRSYTSISESGYPTINYTAAFQFWEFKENEALRSIIVDGLKAFESVYGYRAAQFNAPGGAEHSVIHETLREQGIISSDTAFLNFEHQGLGRYKRELNYTGKRSPSGLLYQVRNVVFEPTDDRGFDPVGYALKQIKAAFFWKRPAIISSHRVNFCGHIDPDNRKHGINALKSLLRQIIQKWPDVEFMAADELNDLI